MDYRQKAKTKVSINGTFIGYASGVSIARGEGMQKVDIIIETDIEKLKTNKSFNQTEDYGKFFQKFSKAFNK